MAERRMFAKVIIDSDAFLDMPLSTQCLYFHLSMRADDDGFVSNPKRIQKMLGASDDDLKLLILKRFILSFDSGVIVIKHWKIHNYIQNDRYKPTTYLEEKSSLSLDGKKAYIECIQTVSILDTQDRIDKTSKDKVSKDDDNNTTSSKFKGIYPNLIEDCPLDKTLDIDLLIEKVNESDFLKSFEVAKVSWFNKHYAEIIAGKYKNFREFQQNKNTLQQRNYSKREMNELFDNLDELDI